MTRYAMTTGAAAGIDLAAARLKAARGVCSVKVTSIVGRNVGGRGADIKAAKPGVFASWKDTILLNRLGQPDEVASVIASLVSGKAACLTGEVLKANDGQDFP